MKHITDNTTKLEVSNQEFLDAIFGLDSDEVIVTNFIDDPGKIADEDKMRCWSAHYAYNYLNKMSPENNQYYCISLFNEGADGKPRRRKAQFKECHVIVVDDVGEKIPLDRMANLPEPAFKLISSAGSEQWGFILNEPCTNQMKVENLLDGLIGKDALTVDGKDTGMKGVTRYVRLPEGSNTKDKRYVNGKPFNCYLSHWAPNNRVSIDALANEFNIDLVAPIANSSSMGLGITDSRATSNPVFKALQPTDERGGGWLNCNCINSDEHSDPTDRTGAAVLIRNDGSIGYKCHHGHCEGTINGPKVLDMLSAQDDTFLPAYDLFRDSLVLNDFDIVPVGNDGKTERVPKFDVDRYVYIGHEEKYYDLTANVSLSKTALNRMNAHLNPDGKVKGNAENLLIRSTDPMQSTADVVGWHPISIFKPDRETIIYKEGGARKLNTWAGTAYTPMEGDVSTWMNLCEYLISDKRERNVVLDYLAFCVQHINIKPGFFLAHRGAHRIGKDLFYKAFCGALGPTITVSATLDDVTGGWGDTLNEKKFLIFEEVSKSQNKDAYNSIKTIVAPTADGLMKINMKGGKIRYQKNVLGGVIMSNRKDFLALEAGDKRFFVFDSYIEPKDSAYYQNIIKWYDNDNGYAKVLDYLMRRDISKFSGAALPFVTDAMKEVIELGKTDYEQDLVEMVTDREAPFDCDCVPIKEFKRVLRDNHIRGGNNGHEAIMKKLGWIKARPSKKINGDVLNVPTSWFFVDNKPLTKSDLADLHLEMKSKVYEGF